MRPGGGGGIGIRGARHAGGSVAAVAAAARGRQVPPGRRLRIFGGPRAIRRAPQVHCSNDAVRCRVELRPVDIMLLDRRLAAPRCALCVPGLVCAEPRRFGMNTARGGGGLGILWGGGSGPHPAMPLSLSCRYNLNKPYCCTAHTQELRKEELPGPQRRAAFPGNTPQHAGPAPLRAAPEHAAALVKR